MYALCCRHRTPRSSWAPWSAAGALALLAALAPTRAHAQDREVTPALERTADAAPSAPGLVAEQPGEAAPRANEARAHNDATLAQALPSARELAEAESAEQRALEGVRATLDPNAPPLPRPERPRAAPRVGQWVMMGLGGASLASSLVLLVLRNQSLTGCTLEDGTPLCSNHDEALRAAQAPSFAAAAIGTATTGFVAITGGFIWWFARRAPAPVNTAFVPLHGGGALQVGAQF